MLLGKELKNVKLEAALSQPLNVYVNDVLLNATHEVTQVAVLVTAKVQYCPIVDGSTLATVEIDHDGPAS